MASRQESGNLLIEVLVAMLVASLFATAVLTLYIQTFAIGDASQQQIMAAATAQECIDSLRALPYSTVAANLGTHYVVVNGQASNDPLFPRPLAKDTGNFHYGHGPHGNAGATNNFFVVNNQVTVTITQQSSNTLLISVSVAWIDNQGTHQYNTSSILVENGLNS